MVDGRRIGTSSKTGAADRLPGLHALRLFAALPIFVLHMAVFVPLQPGIPLEFVRSFGLGVQLFYVLSAFALMHSTRLYEHQPGWVGRFYAKRFFRIAPLFYVMLAVALVYRASVGEPDRSAAEIAANVFFVFNLWPGYSAGIPYAGWSIGVEMLFYLVFPLIFAMVRSMGTAVVLALIAAIAGEIGHFYLGDTILPPLATYADFSIVTNFRYFAFGVLAFLVYDRLRQMSWFAEAGPAAVLQQHLLFGSLVAGIVVGTVSFEETLRAMQRFDMVLWGLAFGVMSVWAALRPLPGLGWAPIQFLGERSYSLYLVHPVIVLLTAPAAVGLSGWLAPAIGFLATLAAMVVVWLVVVAVSAITYALIERPSMKLGARILRKPRRPASQAVEGSA